MSCSEAYSKAVVLTTCTVMASTTASMSACSAARATAVVDLPKGGGAHDLHSHGLHHGVDVHVLALRALQLHGLRQQVRSIPHQPQEALQAAQHCAIAVSWSLKRSQPWKFTV